MSSSGLTRFSTRANRKADASEASRAAKGSTMLRRTGASCREWKAKPS